jgi:hypothetical protein
MANSYPTGSNVRFSAEFKDPTTGAYVDPTTVTFKIKSPETGVITTYSLPPGPQVVKDSVGHYHADYTIDFPGIWYYRWEGSGAYIGAKEYYVCAMDTEF